MFSSNATQVSAVTQAEAVDYDSTNDYLSRSTYYNGYVNALTFLKETFTFSCWFYNGESTGNAYVFSSGASSGNANLFYVNISTTAFQIRAYDGSGTFILNATTTNTLPLNTFCNLIVSCDMTSTSNRYVYVNDQLMTMTWSNYVNSTIQFGTLIQRVNSLSNSVDPTACRISNVFLDFTYRNLSITANRRLFVTADLKPAAGQAALNPIVYLAMSDPTTVGTNTGTGGNFTLNGTIARSGRGPNQYNAAYSTFSGSQFLSRTSNIMSGSQPTALTFSVTFRISGGSGDRMLFIISDVSDLQARIYAQCNSVNQVSVFFYNAARTAYITWQNGQVFAINRNYTLTVSYDCSNGSKSAQLNGVNTSSSIFISGTPPTSFGVIQTTPRLTVGAWFRDGGQPTENYFSGNISNVYLNTSYIDLSVASNLAKFVSGTGINAAPVDLGATGELPTGTSPLIYLPMYGNNAGKNYGTGGDFTVNSGPYTGARGPNEFWGNKADFNGTTGRLSKSTALAGVSDGKTFSFSIYLTMDAAGTSAQSIFQITSNTNNGYFRIILGSDETFRLIALNSAETTILNALSATILSAGTQYHICGSVDLTNLAKASVYINGAEESMTWATYTNDTIDFTHNYSNIGSQYNGSVYESYFNGKLSEFYFTTEYIDFTQEANRLKFRDCFGYPTDLPSAITAASVPTPAIYMRFPPTSFGTNSGTGGDFTPSGTITDGGQL